VEIAPLSLSPRAAAADSAFRLVQGYGVEPDPEVFVWYPTDHSALSRGRTRTCCTVVGGLELARPTLDVGTHPTVPLQASDHRYQGVDSQVAAQALLPDAPSRPSPVPHRWDFD